MIKINLTSLTTFVDITNHFTLAKNIDQFTLLDNIKVQWSILSTKVFLTIAFFDKYLCRLVNNLSRKWSIINKFSNSVKASNLLDRVRLFIIWKSLNDSIMLDSFLLL